MEKIITIQYNTKNYTPTQVEKQTTLQNDIVDYNPTLTERIRANYYKGLLLSNQDKYLVTQGGYFLTYGR